MTRRKYPGPWDFEEWIATPLPTIFGRALPAVLAEVAGWNPQRRTEVQATFSAACADRIPKVQGALSRTCAATYGHPIGQYHFGGEMTTVRPWLDAVSAKAGEGARLVLLAVAARDHNLISEGDFELLTGWWVDAGLPLPEPITNAERQAVVDWWTNLGVPVPDPQGAR